MDQADLEEKAMTVQPEMQISEGDFAWSEDGEAVLIDVNIAAKEGKLLMVVVVVRDVESEKPLLLSTILSVMHQKSGGVTVKGIYFYIYCFPGIVTVMRKFRISMVPQ